MYPQTLLSYSEEAAVHALCGAVTRHIEAANELRAANSAAGRNDDNWWKLYEASIVSLGASKDSVVQQQQTGRPSFDIVRFVNSVILTTLNDPGKWFCDSR